MAGLFGYMAAGAMQGVGEGLVETAKAKRAEALEALQNDRVVAREEASRNFSREENERGRAFTADQNERARAAGGDLITMEDGTSGVRQGSTVKPLLGPDGKPVKTAKMSDSDAPAEVETAEWLIQKGIAASPKEAWELVRQARSDPEKSRAAIYNKWVDALTKGAIGTVDGDKVREQAEKLTEDTLRFLENADAPAASTAAPASTQPAEGKGTAKGGRYPLAPEPSKRKVGSIYSAPNGRIGRWTGKPGKEWELVE